MNSVTLRHRLRELEFTYGGVRAAARHLDCSPAYFVRLRDGEKTQPSDALLARMGLRREVTYYLIRPPTSAVNSTNIGDK